MTAWMWLLVVVGGAAVLGAFLYFGQRQTEKETPLDRRLGEQAARDNYLKAESGRD